jgi:acyl-coenzyme A synthetase/AMP-(fatty) acid ligase
MQHADVALAAVIGVADPEVKAGDEGGLIKPKAFVVLRDAATKKDASVVVASLQEHCKSRLAKHKYPRWIAIVDDLPKNDRGKVDKKTLKQREGVR